jgi:uncharacterized membrane protein
MTEHTGRTPARLDGPRYGADFIVILALSAWMGLLLWAVESGLGGWALAAFPLALGLGYVFFVPGYALQALLFPRRDDLSGMERFGLSGGLSVAWLAVGIHNLEGRAETYRLVVRDGAGTPLESAPVTLNQAAELQQEIRFTPQETVDDVRVEFLLVRAGQSEPYRRLLPRIKVKSGS